MRIVIDFRIFGTKPGGLGRYNQEFLSELKKLELINFKNGKWLKILNEKRVIVVN